MAVALIHQTSRGYPRMINNLASQALLAALIEGKANIDESTTRTAMTEVTTERPPTRHLDHHTDNVITTAPPETPGGAFLTPQHPHRQ